MAKHPCGFGPFPLVPPHPEQVHEPVQIGLEVRFLHAGEPEQVAPEPRTRCPLTFAEFTLKEFEKDKEGNWIDEIPDGNDHSIDAVRYAMLDDILRG